MGEIVPFRRSRSTSVLEAAVVLVAVLVSAGSTRAADDPVAAEAKRHYEEGTKAFNLGEYPRAIAEFKATYNAKPDPLLLYNIAQSYRLAEDSGQALFFYKSFLRNMPTATNRKEVDGRIKVLEKQLADQKKDPSTAPPPVIVPVLPPGPPATATAPGTSAASIVPAGSPPTSSTGSTGIAHDSPNEFPSGQGSPPLSGPLSPTSSSSTELAQANLTTPVPVSPQEPSRPIYKKWWFWAGAAGALIILSGVASANAKRAPETPLGTWDPRWMR